MILFILYMKALVLGQFLDTAAALAFLVRSCALWTNAKGDFMVGEDSRDVLTCFNKAAFTFNN